MAETQIALTPEEESRIKWEQLLRGKPVVVDDPTPAVEESIEVEDIAIAPDEIEDTPEAVLARLFKSMVKD